MWVFICLVWVTLALFLWRHLEWTKFKRDMALAAKESIKPIIEEEIKTRLVGMSVNMWPSMYDKNTIILKWVE